MGQLKRARDSVKRAVGKQDLPYYQSLNESLSVLRDTGSLAGRTMPPAPKANRFFETIPDDHKLQVLTKAKSRARNQTRYAGNIESIKANMQVKVRRYQMEVWRKFSMPFTCLVFIMVGAPLGAIIRKGGFGLPIIISVVIFVVYWIIIITCEKLGKKGTLSPFMAMWLANLVILPLGFFLSYKAMNDSAVLNLEVYKERFQKLIQRLGFK